jgi:NAD(P)H-flavin reductase
LKKRTKKLLLIAGIIGVAFLARILDAFSKSFLLLFFKKEELPSLP